jgi:hypothetical protein
MPLYDRARTVAAARQILAHGCCCLYEVCVDVPRQHWEARVLILDLAPEAIADAIEDEIAAEPEADGRITGCDRVTLHPVPEAGAHLCYVSGEVAGVAASAFCAAGRSVA